jgi:hypothetical protein
MARQLDDRPDLEVVSKRPARARLAVVVAVCAAVALGFTSISNRGDSASPEYVAPRDCITVVHLRPALQTALGAAWDLGDLTSIQSGHSGYEQLYYVAARLTASDGSSTVAIWAANVSDGALPASENTSFVPVNAPAEATGVTHGALEPPGSDPAAEEARRCLQGADD